jgi:hypothetical protein
MQLFRRISTWPTKPTGITVPDPTKLLGSRTTSPFSITQVHAKMALLHFNATHIFPNVSIICRIRPWRQYAAWSVDHWRSHPRPTGTSTTCYKQTHTAHSIVTCRTGRLQVVYRTRINILNPELVYSIRQTDNLRTHFWYIPSRLALLSHRGHNI